jgi:hypothetical protein
VLQLFSTNLATAVTRSDFVSAWAALLCRVDAPHSNKFKAHEVILAEGTPAESYVEYDNRHGFHNAHALPRFTPTTRGPRLAIAYRWRSRECPS